MIFLKDLREEDLKLILNWKKKKGYLSNENALIMEFQKKWFDDVEKDVSCKYWSINNGSIKIGIAGINHLDISEKSCDLECIVEEKYFRNRGIEKIVFFNLLEYAFNKFNLEKIYIHELENNMLNDYKINVDAIEKRDIIFDTSIEFFGQKFICIKKINWENIKENNFLEIINID